MTTTNVRYDEADRPFSVLLIASQAIVSQWNSRDSRTQEVMAITDADHRTTKAEVRQRRPRVVVLEESLAEGKRGTRFVGWLRSEQGDGGLDVRLLPAGEVAALLSSTSDWTAQALVRVSRPLSPRAFRRARRVRVDDAAQATLDGRDCTLVDMSTLGVQVVASSVLRPGQRVRLVVNLVGERMRLTGKVAWSAMEIKPAAAFRAGVEFEGSVPSNLDSLLSQFAEA
jgi:hypothetical protein